MYIVGTGRGPSKGDQDPSCASGLALDKGDPGITQELHIHLTSSMTLHCLVFGIGIIFTLHTFLTLPHPHTSPHGRKHKELQN